jgi:hypothetical protein
MLGGGNFTAEDRKDLKELVKCLPALMQWKNDHEKFDKESRRVCQEGQKCFKDKVLRLDEKIGREVKTLHTRIEGVLKDHITPLATAVHMGKGGWKVLVFGAIVLGSIGAILGAVALFMGG